MQKINVLAFGGLGGAVFSAGLKTILMRLQRIEGVDYCTYENYASWRRWAQTLRGWRDPTVMIGHSFGVTSALAVARSLRNAGGGPHLPLLVAFDPSKWWWSNPALMASGGNAVPDTIKGVVNFYQASDRTAEALSRERIAGRDRQPADRRHDAQPDRGPARSAGRDRDRGAARHRYSEASGMRTAMDLQWWITVIGVPLVGALFWLRFHDRNETDAALRNLKDELANYKLLVATSFVTATSMKDLEGRIMSHLDKIEKKIDRVIEQKHPPG